MSEVIEDYIRRHPGLLESEAFDEFVRQDRIRQWLSADASRHERLRVEFGRVWENLQSAAGGTRGAVSMRETDQLKQRLQVQVTPQAPPVRLSLLCSVCNRIDIWRAGDVISCHNCGRVFDDMLELVPVKAVGPFAFAFGEGIGGVAVAVGLLLLLILLYGVLRWV